MALLALLATAAVPAAANPRWEDATVTDRVLEPVAAVALDRGRPRVVYVAAHEEGSAVTYASCDGECHEAGSWDEEVVRVGDVFADVAIEVDPWGRPHVAFREHDAVSYTTCHEDCGEPASWTVGWSGRGGDFSLALDAWGRPRVAVTTDTGDLVFASCDRTCGSSLSWTAETLAASLRHASAPSLAYLGVRPHLAFVRATSRSDVRRVAYLTCERDCLSPESWDGTSVEVWNASGPTSLAVDGEVVRLTAVAHRQAPHHELWTCVSVCTTAPGWSRTRGFGTNVADAELQAVGTPRVAYVAGDGRLVHWDCPGRGGCEDGHGWEGETLVNDTLGSVGLAVDGGQPVVVAVTGRQGSNDGLHVFRCSACGEPGSYGPPPSGSPAPSTSTYAPESSTNWGSHSDPSPDGGGRMSTTSTTVAESAPRDSVGGRTSWTLPGPGGEASGDPTVRERYRLEGPHSDVHPADPGTGGPRVAPPDREEHAAGPPASFADRGASALAATLFLAFAGLAVLVYLRLVRPLAQIRRR